MHANLHYIHSYSNYIFAYIHLYMHTYTLALHTHLHTWTRIDTDKLAYPTKGNRQTYVCSQQPVVPTHTHTNWQVNTSATNLGEERRRRKPGKVRATKVLVNVPNVIRDVARVAAVGGATISK